MKTPLLLLLLLALQAASFSAARANWIDNGINVCSVSGDQIGGNQTSDGSGGALLAWLDQRVSGRGIYAQRVGATGGLEWDPNGVALYLPASGNPQAPELTSDGDGGAIVVWPDYRPSVTDIYAQRVDGMGTVKWTAAGVPICVATGYQFGPVAVPDGAGGAIIAWFDQRGANDDIYAQRVNASGTVLWALNGVAVCSATGVQSYPQILPDGAGGAFLCWTDERSGNVDIYAQRINASGVRYWALNGIAVCALTSGQYLGKIASDGAGGMLVSWTDSRSGNNDTYVQRINSSGSAVWTANGVAACSDPSSQGTPTVTTDGGGGAIVAWEDPRPGLYGIYAQRIGSGGTAQWTANGVRLTPSASLGSQLLPQLLADGAGGALVCWHLAGSGGNVEAQRVDALGNRLFGNSGVKVCSAPTGQQLVRIGSDGAGGAIVSWQDERSADLDIRVQQLNPSGCTGYLAPAIQSVEDVPGDQGGLVRLAFDRSNGDRPDVFESAIASYTIWQRIDDLATSAAILREGRAVDDHDFASGPRAGGKSSVQAAESGAVPLVGWRDRLFLRSEAAWTACKPFPPGTWEAVLSLGATRQGSYVGRVSTVRDSSDVSIPYSVFVVTAHTSATPWYISAPDSGYSVDNIPPGPPSGLIAAYNTGSGNQLQWNPPVDEDFQYFRIYRGASPGFVPGPGTLVDTTVAPAWSDPDYDSGSVFYKVTSVDQAGNESSPTAPATVTAVGERPHAVAALYANSPNPFNPRTSIAYSVPVDGTQATLAIYHASGRRVRVLASGAHTAGLHRVEWDGRDDTGASVSSGVYLYRLSIAESAQVRTMVLLR